MDIALEKTVNEVKYWLTEHDKQLDADTVTMLARRALHLYTDTDYSSLENAVADILDSHFKDEESES